MRKYSEYMTRAYLEMSKGPNRVGIALRKMDSILSEKKERPQKAHPNQFQNIAPIQPEFPPDIPPEEGESVNV